MRKAGCATLSSVADRRDDSGTKIKERTDTREREPTRFQVVLLNDDYSPMNFVIHVLETVFQKSPAEAYRVMMQVHVDGRGVAGVYTFEIAETKSDKVGELAHEAGFPLRAIVEEA